MLPALMDLEVKGRWSILYSADRNGMDLIPNPCEDELPASVVGSVVGYAKAYE